jgi:hypothetical protein
VSEPKRRDTGPLESRRRRFGCAIELEDMAARPFDLDKLRNAWLRIRLDCRRKSSCSRLPSKFGNGNTGFQLKTDVERRLSVGRSEDKVVMVITD